MNHGIFQQLYSIRDNCNLKRMCYASGNDPTPNLEPVRMIEILLDV
ncbi:hypothetical protein LBBP_00481 [Leptospira borgpetersenii serovar Ballum]|uniref:Uncharacterized protein n=1 Tax=Leptospira borgpetersenii serovar Ballum TaxID=280505 RepID=A0A0S2IMY3_LEPBO|nr:hypothetical protein LBBP_00481 [Leptospira borgpetersenii serovar Ballum]